MPSQRITTILTAIIVGLWLISAIVRIWVSWPPAAVLDSIMPLVIGYWFVTSGSKSNGKEAVST